MHPDTGIISLQKKFIKSKASEQYQLTVRASDRGTPSLSSTAFVEMFIINKDQPMFAASNYFGEVLEDAQIDDVVATVKAKGAKNRQVYYQIVEGDEYEQFHVGFTTGNCHSNLCNKNLFSFLQCVHCRLIPLHNTQS